MSANEPPRVSVSDFERLERLGAGASGEVWKARVSRNLPFAKAGDHVALKLYNKEILQEPNQRMRIAEEYKTGKTLVHHNLVGIFHVDIEEMEQPFLVMEWCDGVNLEQWRLARQLPDEGFLLQFTTQMLDVLDFLHSSRRLHRDVKPTNINIDVKGIVRLLDYGIIRSLREPSFTQSGARFVGTYRYAAPEYIFDNKYSFTSDLYSLGAVLYFLLHGKEIFYNVSRTPDIIMAKREHRLPFNQRLEEYGPVWKVLLDLCKGLLDSNPRNRPASAMACQDTLAKAVPSSIPFRSYFACALTRASEDKKHKEHVKRITEIIKRNGHDNGFAIYFPGEHTDPQDAPDLTAPEVYWIDRERVASADLLVILADEPSFGVGQEAEIAASAGVPIVIFHSADVNVSRMLRGIAGRIISLVSFTDDADLDAKAAQFFGENKGRLHLSRLSREREYHLRVGHRVREIRETLGLSVEELAEKAEVNKELLDSLETRPEQLSTISLVNLRRIARGLSVSPAELVRDQSAKDQQFEEIRNVSINSLREFARQHQLSYEQYTKLKAHGLQDLRQRMSNQAGSLAAKGYPKPFKEEEWRTYYHRLIDSPARYDEADPLSDD